MVSSRLMIQFLEKRKEKRFGTLQLGSLFGMCAVCTDAFSTLTIIRCTVLACCCGGSFEIILKTVRPCVLSRLRRIFEGSVDFKTSWPAVPPSGGKG